MYKLVYLPHALEDLVEIATYIAKKLNNPIAAENITSQLVEKAESLKEFPYVYPVHNPIRKLNKEYRKLRVKNWIMFYYVNEGEKTITIARAIYGKCNFENILE